MKIIESKYVVFLLVGVVMLAGLNSGAVQFRDGVSAQANIQGQLSEVCDATGTIGDQHIICLKYETGSRVFGPVRVDQQSIYIYNLQGEQCFARSMTGNTDQLDLTRDESYDMPNYERWGIKLDGLITGTTFVVTLPTNGVGVCHLLAD